MNLVDIIKKQKSFSLNTFGPGERSCGMKSVVIPYLAREADKGGREDLKKAHHTLGIYLELTEPKKVNEPKDLGQTISNLTSRTELALPPERKKAKRQPTGR